MVVEGIIHGLCRLLNRPVTIPDSIRASTKMLAKLAVAGVRAERCRSPTSAHLQYVNPVMIH